MDCHGGCVYYFSVAARTNKHTLSLTSDGTYNTIHGPTRDFVQSKRVTPERPQLSMTNIALPSPRHHIRGVHAASV